MDKFEGKTAFISGGASGIGLAMAREFLNAGMQVVIADIRKAALDKAGVPAETANAIVRENSDARLAGLRSSLSLLATVALIALFATRRIPARQPSAASAGEPSQTQT